MAINERQSQIVQILKENKRMSVKKLAERLFVCEMTIRRDLKELEQLGYVNRYNGGAVYSREYDTLPISSRKLLHSAEKKKISAQSRKYLSDSITVYIDSSSTSLYVIPILSEYKDVTVVTNSVQCLIVASKYHIPCIMAGGSYYEHDMCTVGSLTDDFLRNFNLDVGFFSSKGLSDDGIISDGDINQTSARKAVMLNCKKRIFLFDNTKQHKKFTYTLCTTDDVDDIILV